MSAFVRRRGSVRAEIDWLGKAGGVLSAADYRKAVEAKRAERDVQREAVRHFRAALPPRSLVLALPNQRALAHLDKEARRKALQALVADGMVPGACDLLVTWDARLGAPGNRGVAWIEFKRPVGAKPPTVEQIAFLGDLAALGHVAGVATSLEEAEDILIEAGAPLRFRLPRQSRPASATPETERGAPAATGSAPRHHRGTSTT